VASGTNIQSKQARVLRYIPYSKTGAKPEELVRRSRHWVVEIIKKTALKKQANMTQQ